jgi:vacuolar-type H+-ATPase subunit I/STV1
MNHKVVIKERLITEVGSEQGKNEEKINREKHEICQLTSILKDNKQELEFLIEHGSNNSSNLLSEVTAMSIKLYCSPCFNLTPSSLTNSVSVCLLSSFTC